MCHSSQQADVVQADLSRASMGFIWPSRYVPHRVLAALQLLIRIGRKGVWWDPVKQDFILGDPWAARCGPSTNELLEVGGGSRAKVREVMWDKSQVS